MKCTFAHNNLNVLNLEKSLAFYEKALGLHVVRKKETPDFTLCFLFGRHHAPHAGADVAARPRKTVRFG